MVVMVLIFEILAVFAPATIVFLFAIIFVDGFTVGRGLKACITGLIVVVPIVVLQTLYHKIAGEGIYRFFTILVLNGVIEEGVKLLALRLLYSGRSTRIDMLPLRVVIALSLVLSLTMSSFETLVYSLHTHSGILIRIGTAGVIHALCAMLSAFFLYIRGQGEHHYRPLIESVFIHTLYNYLALLPIALILRIVVVAFAIAECRYWWTVSRVLDMT